MPLHTQASHQLPKWSPETITVLSARYSTGNQGDHPRLTVLTTLLQLPSYPEQNPHTVKTSVLPASAGETSGPVLSASLISGSGPLPHSNAGSRQVPEPSRAAPQDACSPLPPEPDL